MSHVPGKIQMLMMMMCRGWNRPEPFLDGIGRCRRGGGGRGGKRVESQNMSHVPGKVKEMMMCRSWNDPGPL